MTFRPQSCLDAKRTNTKWSSRCLFCFGLVLVLVLVLVWFCLVLVLVLVFGFGFGFVCLFVASGEQKT